MNRREVRQSIRQTADKLFVFTFSADCLHIETYSPDGYESSYLSGKDAKRMIKQLALNRSINSINREVRRRKRKEEQLRRKCLKGGFG